MVISYGGCEDGGIVVILVAVSTAVIDRSGESGSTSSIGSV